MDAFDYLAVVFSVIMGLALMQLLQGFAACVRETAHRAGPQLVPREKCFVPTACARVTPNLAPPHPSGTPNPTRIVNARFFRSM